VRPDIVVRDGFLGKVWLAASRSLSTDGRSGACRKRITFAIDGPMSQHVCIVGAGIVGLFSAWRLLREGHRVTLLEGRNGPGLATSFANGAQLSYSYVAPLAEPAALGSFPGYLLDARAPLCFRPSLSPRFWSWCCRFAAHCTTARAQRTTRELLALGFLSRRCLHALLDEYPDPALHHRQNGKLVLYRDADSFRAAQRRLRFQAQFGCEQFALQAAECVAVEPALAGLQERLTGGIHTPSEDVIDSHALCLHLAALIRRGGGEIRYAAPVRGQRFAGGRIAALLLPDSEIAADQFVLAGGIESRDLLAGMGLRVPLLGLKGYSLTVDCAQGVAPSLSITDSRHRIVFARLGDRLRVAGMVDMGNERTDIPARRLATLIRQARAVFPLAGDYDQAEPWAGLRPATPSGRPLIDRVGHANLYVNVGHGTLGLTLAAGSAELLADRLAGRPCRIDATPFLLANA